MCEPFVIRQFLVLNDLAQSAKLQIVPDGNRDHLVAGMERLVRHDARMRVAKTTWILPWQMVRREGAKGRELLRQTGEA